METKIHCASSDTALHKGLNELVDQHLAHLDRCTKRFPVRNLQIHLEKHQSSQLYELKISLVLASEVVSTNASSPYLESAVSLGFRKLLRQLRMHKESLRRSRTYEKVRDSKESAPDPEELAALAAELEERVARQDFLGFRSRLTDLLPRLEMFVRRELRFHVEGQKLFGRRELAREVVEEALLHTFEKFREKPVGLDPEKWIFRHALELVGIYVANAKEEMLENEWTIRQGVSGPKAGDSDGEEQSQEDFLEEFEGFPMEVVDFDALLGKEPEKDNSTDGEWRQSLHEALDQLPEEERKALFLCFMDGFRPVEAAVVLNCSEERLRHLIDQGANRLRGVFAKN